MAFNIVAGVNNALYGSVSGSGSYGEGAEVTLTVSPEDGYRFVSWDDSNTDNPRVFNASEDITLIATLEAIPEYAVTLTVNNNNFGTVSGSGSYREGSTATISATPALHCRFVKWDDNNTDNPRTLTVNAAVTLEAIFETVNWYTITAVSSDDTMGSVTGAGDYDEGDSVTLTAVPETDHKFVEWSDGNVDNPRTFTASQSLSLSATFAAIVYTDVTIASNDNELGTVSGATSGNIETGSSVTFTATPATDCKFDGWQVDGEMLEDTSTTITLTVAENEMDVIAVFSAIVFYQFNLISSDTECGTVSITSASETARGDANNIYPEGTVITVAAAPTAAGKFLNWGDGLLELTRTIYLTENTTLRANFYPASGLILVTSKMMNKIWTSIKSFFSASTGASKIGAPANNVLGATTLADVVSSVGQPGGIAVLNNSGKVAAADIDGTLSNDTSGNAATASVADKVGTSTVGSSTEPVYINAGTPTACGGSLAADITGNAATATKATQDGSGNTITSTYATIAKTYDDTTNTSYRGMRGLDGSTSGWVRTTTSGIIPVQSGAAGSGHSGLGTSSWYFATAYIDNIYGKLNGNCTGSSGSCTGNAATATSATSATTATNANNAKLTHTVGNTEYPLVFGTSFVITDAQQALRIGTPTATAANCALRAKAYCAAANTQGEAYLVCGNNIALASANNSRGSVYLYGTNTGYTRLLPGNNTTSNITLTLPSATGTIALTSSNITGSSASCTGNAATATSATSATTATNANNIKTTTGSGAWYDIVGVATGFTSGSNYAPYSNNTGSVSFYVDANATSGNQRGILRLGNATANTTAAGHSGALSIYGTSTGYTHIVPGYNSTGSIILTLPSSGGTLALANADTTGSASKWGGYAISVVTALPSSPNASTIYFVK